MKKRIFGKTGLSVSPLCIGAWQLAGPLEFDGQPDGHPDPGKSSVISMIHELGDMGINCIDTAEQYGGGESERRVGEAICGNRDNWIVSTKFGYRVGPNGARDDSSAPETIRTSIEGSLRRLNTDYIDIYLYHCAPHDSELEGGREVLERLLQEGKCRYYGISTDSVELVKKMVKLGMIHVLQYPSNMLMDTSELRALCVCNNIGTQVRGVMAQGRLSGKYFDSQPDWQSDDNRAKLPPTEDFTKFRALMDAVPEGYSMAQAAVRWILDQSASHTICMGAKSIDDYRTAIEALELPPLTEDAVSVLSEYACAIAKNSPV